MKTPRVVLSSTSESFDPLIVRHWREEGFSISYLPSNSNVQDYIRGLTIIADGLDLGEQFAVIGATSFTEHQIPYIQVV